MSVNSIANKKSTWRFIYNFMEPFKAPTRKLLKDLFKVAVDQVGILLVTAFAVPIMTLAAYLVYSGDAVVLIGRVLYQACSATGTCHDMPLTLTLSASGFMLTTAVFMMVARAFWFTPVSQTARSDSASMADLLITWYRMSGWERSYVLKLLRSSELDVDEELVDGLELEHLEMERIEAESSGNQEMNAHRT
jgi:hypothetical protein